MKHASEDIRNLAVSLYRSGKYTQQKVAEIVGYHVNTIRSWLKIDAQGLPQRSQERGHRPRILNQDDLVRLQALANSGTCGNLDELTDTFGKGSRSVIHRALIELGYTYKKKTIFADQRKSPEVKQERDEWWEWVARLSGEDLKHLVFIDESCAKTNFTPLYGWAMRGERCYGYVPLSWERYTMLSSIRLDGSTESIIFEKGLDKATFEYYVNDILAKALRPGDILIMDNLRAHKIDFSRLTKKKIEVKFLPRYSPDLNPIEMMWSQIKTKLRKTQPRNFNDLWYEYSIAHLDVTAKDAQGWFRGCGYFH